MFWYAVLCGETCCGQPACGNVALYYCMCTATPHVQDLQIVSVLRGVL